MILRTCIGIPVYNNPRSVARVALDCLRHSKLPILVIDDGSDEPVLGLLAAERDRDLSEALAKGRLRVLRLPENRGKGIAIQEAIRDCVGRGFTHLLTLDADGQHLASEIDKLLEEAKAYPWDLIIGSRKLQAETVPGISKFGRRFSNFWVRYQTGDAISDSQSGMRLYPLFFLQTQKFRTKRYDFEIEVLIRLLWKGVLIREVEIEVHYPEKSERISHFDKFWDNARISILNTVLVALTLLKAPRSPTKAAFSVGIGILIGCTPFFGFHSLILAGFAFAFRLNFVLMFLGSQISIPPLAPFLAGASVFLGLWLRGDPNGLAEWRNTLAHPTLHDATAQFVSWLVGSLALGAVLGLAGGLVAYVAISRVGAGSVRQSNWNGRSRGGALGLFLMRRITRYLGLRAAYFCLYFIVPYFYLFAPKARRSMNEYWSVQRPEASTLLRQWLIVRHFYTFAAILVDRVYQSYSDRPRFPTFPNGAENLSLAFAAKKGAILMTAHAGAWDLASSSLEAHGMTKDFHRIEYELRSRSTPSILATRELLEQQRPVGIMGDRPLGGHFELVPFLGKLAPLDVTAFRIAAACGAPLVFTFGFKARNGYDFYMTPPRRYAFSPGEDKELQTARWAEEYARTLETHLRKYPDQWFNFFPFWSSRPVPPPGIPFSTRPSRLAEELRKPARRELGLEPAATPSVE